MFEKTRLDLRTHRTLTYVTFSLGIVFSLIFLHQNVSSGHISRAMGFLGGICAVVFFLGLMLFIYNVYRKVEVQLLELEKQEEGKNGEKR